MGEPYFASQYTSPSLPRVTKNRDFKPSISRETAGQISIQDTCAEDRDKEIPCEKYRNHHHHIDQEKSDHIDREGSKHHLEKIARRDPVSAENSKRREHVDQVSGPE